MYLYKAWRTPLFLLVSWGRTESLEENQPPREERRGPQQPVGQDEATSYEGEDPSDSSSNSQRVFCSFPTFHFSVPLQEPPSSAPEQFSWTVNRNSHRLWAHGTSGWSFARHTPSLTTASPQPWWPQPFSYHSQPSAIVTTPLLLPQPALSHGDHNPSPTTASPQPWWPHPFSNHSQPSAMVVILWASMWNVVSPWGWREANSPSASCWFLSSSHLICFGFSVEFRGFVFCCGKFLLRNVPVLPCV